MQSTTKKPVGKTGFLGRGASFGFWECSSSKPLIKNWRTAVNVSCLYFHLRPLAGLLYCGFWAERLSMWLPTLDQAARLLRDVIGGRR